MKRSPNLDSSKGQEPHIHFEALFAKKPKFWPFMIASKIVVYAGLLNYIEIMPIDTAIKWMDTALSLANQAAAMGEVPVGAIIVKNEAIIARAHNLTMSDKDPCAHAEILAIRAAAKQLGSERLYGCDLWVTLEPCAMCAGAIAHARLDRLYYGAADPKGGGVEHGPLLFSQNTIHHRPEIYSGFRADESAALLREFFQKHR